MSLTNEELVKVRELIADGTGTFEEGEKITYSLKYALNLTTKDPASAAGFEFLSAPRIFPSSIPNKDLIKINEGDINSDGKDSNDNLVDITAPYDTVKQYKIIDPITNKVSNKNVNDILGTSFSSIASVWSNKAEEIPDENTFSTGTVYRHWFHDYNTSPYNEVLEPANNWKGIRLAYKRATVGEIVQEGHADFVPHISLYLGVPLKAIPDSSWAGGTGDSISYEHAKDKGRYLLGLLGLSNTFKTRILKNDYTTIKIDTASANEGDTWFTNPSYGLLSLYGIKDTKESGSAGIGDSAGTNTPRISFCRYIGGTATFSGGSSVTVGGVGEDAPTNGAKGDLFYDIDDPKLQINKDGTSNGWVKVGGESWTENESDIYRSSGNVGIGTENPKAKLNVAGKLNDTNNTIPSNYGGDSTTTCVLGHGRDTGGDDYWGLNIGTTWSGLSYIQGCHINGSSFYDLLLNPKGGNVNICGGGGTCVVNGNCIVSGTFQVGNIELGYTNEINNWGGPIYLQFRTSHNIMLCNGGGYVGIDCDPEYHLHAHGDIMADGGWLRTTGNHGFYSQTHGRGIYFTDSNWLRCYGSFAFYNHTGVSLNWKGYYFDEDYSYRWHNGTSTISIECAEGIVADWVGTKSDRRIKKNIEDIDDGDALELLRKIPVRYYSYKDEVKKGTQKVSGFIAQEVKEVFPMAVTIGPNTTPIPNILKKITNEVWEEITDSSENKWLLKKFDLIDSSGVILPADISGGKSYKFSMQDEINKKGDTEIILSDSSGNFIFKKKWKYLFLYGICVDDFLIVDKNKIFAINFSASQEIDRIQQAEKTKLEEQTSKLEEHITKLTVAETKLAVAETKLAVAETKLAVAETKLAVAEAKITELEAENSTLNVDIAAIKAHLGL